MEKFWNKASLTDLQKCFDILNNQSLIEQSTYKNFAIQLFEIAKKQLGCNNCTLNFVDNMQNNLGVSSPVNKTVTLNLSKMEKQTLYKTVSTIYHELTHIHQDATKTGKQVDTSYVAQFPFERCYGNENFLPPQILGISPFLFYYTCQHEKQARDVGSECAMELFVELQKLAQTQPTKNGTIRLIERCINQVQLRWDKENADNEFASQQINAFFKQNPNFLQNSLSNIQTEFLMEAMRTQPASKERFLAESKFNKRIGSLVLLGCDDNIKNQILTFVFKNFVNNGEKFNTLISVIDSPYSKVTKADFDLLFKLANIVNCPKDVLLNLLVSWDKNYVNKIVNGNKTSVNINKFEL